MLWEYRMWGRQCCFKTDSSLWNSKQQRSGDMQHPFQPGLPIRARHIVDNIWLWSDKFHISTTFSPTISLCIRCDKYLCYTIHRRVQYTDSDMSLWDFPSTCWFAWISSHLVLEWIQWDRNWKKEWDGKYWRRGMACKAQPWSTLGMDLKHRLIGCNSTQQGWKWWNNSG